MPRRAEPALGIHRHRADPYQNEWNDLIDAIRNDKPYNEVKRGVEASLVTSMGRMAAHTGQEITFEQFMKLEHEYAPGCGQVHRWIARPRCKPTRTALPGPDAGHLQGYGIPGQPGQGIVCWSAPRLGVIRYEGLLDQPPWFTAAGSASAGCESYSR